MAMKNVVSTINFITSRGLNYRQFKGATQQNTVMWSSCISFAYFIPSANTVQIKNKIQDTLATVQFKENVVDMKILNTSMVTGISDNVMSDCNGRPGKKDKSSDNSKVHTDEKTV